ncbi:MAG TPA: aspartate carbamoyltransferase catalytic subunit [Acidimicrobiia bacterium]|nr:aspartate carbamoyltransferase catalytic subunit [Acidimicrobiia bacterium]
MSGLLTLRGVTADRLGELLDAGQRHVELIRSGASAPVTLARRTVTIAFFEPSTRTRLSFEKAAMTLGATVLTLGQESSTVKGESFRDTIQTLTAMGSDALVIRHHLADAAELAARWSGIPVVNAGVGRREHPTQTLIDALTLRQHFGTLHGLRMGMVGDVRNSRVARGHLNALPTLGVELTLIGPSTLLPDANPWGARTSHSLDEELGDLDVVYLFRIQRERGAGTGLPSEPSYHLRYGMSEERLSLLKPTSMIMHAGPMNRGVEIDDAVADGERSLILSQVANGVPMRMAVLEDALGGRS